MNKGNSQICPMILALALGIVWGLSAASLAWASALFGYGTAMVNLMGSVYIGFNASFLGGLIGLVWGFFDMFIGAWLVILVYRLIGCMSAKCCSSSESCCTPDESCQPQAESESCCQPDKSCHTDKD